MLDVAGLRVIRAIADQGSFTAAARSLGYTQPAISQMIRRVERRAGTALVERVGRTIRLTEAGTVLAHHAVGVLSALEAAEREVSAIAGIQTGTVRLTAFPSASATLVPGALAQLRARFPQLAVRFLEAEPPESLAALAAGQCDVVVAFDYEPGGLAKARVRADDGRGSLRSDRPAVLDAGNAGRATTALAPDMPLRVDRHQSGAGPGDGRANAVAPAVDASRLVTVPLLRDQVRVAVRHDDPVVRARTVRLGSLHDRAWIAGCPKCRSHLVMMCREAGFEPEVSYETEDYVAVLGLVAAGLGVAVVPDLALRGTQHSEVVVRPMRPASYRRVYAATTPDLLRVPAVRATMDALRAGAGALQRRRSPS